MKIVKVCGYVVGALTGAYLALSFSLTFWPTRVFNGHPTPSPEIFAAQQRAQGVVTDQAYPFVERRFTVRDGAQIFARVFDAPSRTTIVLLHGVASSSAELNIPSGLLRAATGARVVTLDLRGHGHSSGQPWQVAYGGQYEDDLADVIAMLRKENPKGRIVLAGHSMGGGIVLRYALLGHAPPVEGYLLIAPLMGGDSLTGQITAPSGAPDGSQFVTFRTPRLFGILMLNLVGIRALNDLPILYFNMPGLPAYGFGALQSMQPNAPKDYRTALAAMNAPLLLVAGSHDEAFNAGAYAKIVKQYAHGGTTTIVDGDTHNGVLHDARAIAAIGGWLATH